MGNYLLQFSVSRLSILAIVVASFFVFLQFPGFVHAQSSAGVRISPSIIEDRVDPGDSFQGQLKVTNLETTERTFYIIARDISALSETGSPIFAEPGEITGFELSQWVDVPVDSITLLPGEDGLVDFSVVVPEDATPGGHFGGIFLSAEPARQRTTGAGVGYQVGTIMNFRISGDIREEAQIREFVTDKFVYGENKVELEVTVENQGNVLIRPRGPIEITDMFGNRVEIIRMNDDGSAVLPNGKRSFRTSWISDGLHFGRYEALVALVYGEDGRKTISAATSFWILPLRVIIPVLASLFLIILIVYLIMRWYIRRRLEEMYRHSRGRASARGRGRMPARVARERAQIPKFAVVLIALLVFTMLFLAVLFLFFA